MGGKGKQPKLQDLKRQAKASISNAIEQEILKQDLQDYALCRKINHLIGVGDMKTWMAEFENGFARTNLLAPDSTVSKAVNAPIGKADRERISVKVISREKEIVPAQTKRRKPPGKPPGKGKG